MKVNFKKTYMTLFRVFTFALCTTILLAACNTGGDDTPSLVPDDSGIVDTLPGPALPPVNDDNHRGTPLERHGKLQVIGGQLCDSTGSPVQLKGMSSFGLQWGEGFWVLTDDAFDVLADDWECDIIRLAMYVGENGYASNPSVVLARVEKGIELASARGMYVMVDWHVLTPGNPIDDVYLTAGLDDPDMPAEFLALRDAHPDWTGPQVFFGYLAQKYGAQGNMLWETANEPNGLGSFDNRFTVWSERLKPYHESIIEVIRLFDIDGIVICGTDNWSQYVDAPINDPLDDANVMYSMHFYAGTHDIGYDRDPNNPDVYGTYWLRKMTDDALAAGLAVFCTEWGTSEASGDGGPFINYSTRWMEYLDTNRISWCAWSMAQKNEKSSAFNTSVTPNPSGAWPDEQMTTSGRFYRAMIKGEPVPMYPGPPEHNGDVSRLPVVDSGEFDGFTFEDGTLEGWARNGASTIENSDISVGVAETNALTFPLTLIPGNEAWEDGARLGSPFWSETELPLSRCAKITAFTMDLFLDVDSASTGTMQLVIIPEPDGAGWWYEAGTVEIDPVNDGEVITNDFGKELRKYTIELPFSISQYSERVRVRSIILVLYNNEGSSDFSGNVYFDNIGFMFE